MIPLCSCFHGSILISFVLKVKVSIPKKLCPFTALKNRNKHWLNQWAELLKLVEATHSGHQNGMVAKILAEIAWPQINWECYLVCRLFSIAMILIKTLVALLIVQIILLSIYITIIIIYTKTSNENNIIHFNVSFTWLETCMPGQDLHQCLKWFSLKKRINMGYLSWNHNTLWCNKR